MAEYDYLIVGSGLFGAVFAYEAKKKTLVLTFQGKLTVFLNKWLNSFMDNLVYNTLKKEKDSPLK